MNRFGGVIAFWVTVCVSASAADYHLDAVKGDDANSGQMPQLAWRSLARANKCVFKPGDRLLLAAGQSFSGPLRLGQKASGTKDRPILITSYGQGRATIAAGAGSGIELDQCDFVVVKELNVVGSGRKEGNNGNGIHLRRTKSVLVDHVEVSGFRLSGLFGDGDVDSRLTWVTAHDNGYAGINAKGWGEYRCRNLYIGHCTADNNPGDPMAKSNHSGNGIILGGVDGAVVEYSHASRNGWDMPRKGNGPVGIWCWESSRVIIQHCIAHDNQSPGDDGGGFDFDGGTVDSVLQYNLSYNNQGPGYEFCQYHDASPWKNNIMRYNISYNDGTKNFHSGLALWKEAKAVGFGTAEVYQNTIIHPLCAIRTDGEVPGMIYRNNIFISGQLLLEGTFAAARFESNLWWRSGNRQDPFCKDGKSTHVNFEGWIQATGQEAREGKSLGWFADPKLHWPEKLDQLPMDPEQLKNLAFFLPAAGSPCLKAGMQIKGAGSRDLIGRQLLDPRCPTLGALEVGR